MVGEDDRGHCPMHEAEIVKREQNTKEIADLKHELFGEGGLKAQLTELRQEQALTNLRIKNLRAPVWIIAVYALSQMAFKLFDLSPIIKEVAQVVR